MSEPRPGRINIIIGWIIFLVSGFVYISTVEPTVSFWDCGEFILSSWKLQVGHPPGAPLFLMLGRVFSLFSFGNQSNAALMINIMSALASAFTIMFLYWTIVHLAGKIYSRTDNNSDPITQIWVMAAGVIGALAYAFSDTFWFSAVEAEVYATSSLFTAVVFWAILKWENEADKSYSGRWLILIAYLMGLSIGVHLLNLLALPAIVLVYYFKNNEASIRGILKALGFSALLLFLMVFGLLPYTVKMAGWFELLFVNLISLPYNSGLYIYLLSLIALLAWGINYSIKRKKQMLNLGLTLLAAVMIGYSSIAMIMIRANAKPPMNQNDPSDLFSMIYYVNREQYGSAPLIKGQYYSAPVIDVKREVGGYVKAGDKYEPYNRAHYKYDSRFTTIFPRMYSNDQNHIREYEYWADIRGKKVTVSTGSGTKDFTVPTFSENIRFFLRYQTGFMYWRYFMWNFAGRQNDIQGNGNILHGNWISGIPFIDNQRLGNQDSLPDDLKNNPGRNRYYFLPLLFGLAGLFWQFKRSKEGLWVVGTLFIMTGIAIVVYLNQYPLQPRERDYAYAGSFYAFSIWIGFGALMLFDLVSRIFGKKIALIAVFPLSIILVPAILITQNWDDHNRSGRYTARDIGANYLNSCDLNAILFTYGDNDSFPLWYVQDVEGIRTDVRVANLSYLSAGWYIDMMKHKAYDSDPLPISLAKEKYRPGEREQLPVIEQIERPIDINDILDFVELDDKQAKIDFTGMGDYYNYIPVKKFLIPVDTIKVKENGTVDKRYWSRLSDQVTWEYPGREMYKNDLVIMDIIGTNKWVRPIYYASTVPPQNYKGLDKFFKMEGLAYRIVPVDTLPEVRLDYGELNTEKMYNNLLNRFKWGNASDPDVYLDEVNRRMFNNFRRMFGTLATALAMEGDTARAVEVLHRSEDVIPLGKVPYNYYAISLLEGYLATGMFDEAMLLADNLINNSVEYLDYISGLDYLHRYGLDIIIAMNLESLRSTYSTAIDYGIPDLARRLEPLLDRYFSEFYN